MFPTFVGGLPGGMELAVLFLILVTLGLVAFVLLAGGRAVFGRASGNVDQPRVADLESRVADLETELDALRDRVDDEN